MRELANMFIIGPVNVGLFSVLCSALYVKMMQSSQLEDNEITVSYSSEFPHYNDQLFYIQFAPRIGEFPVFSVLIFIIRDGVDILELGYFYPGFYYDLEYPYIGKYFELLVATVLHNYVIKLRIRFNEKANYKLFEIRYGEFVSREKMEFGKKNYLLLTRVKYSKTVHLYLRTLITMKTLTLDGRTDGLVMDETGTFVCHGSGGSPVQRVTISGLRRFEVINQTYDVVTNTHQVRAVIRLHDHKSRFYCSTKDSQDSYEIKVFHHPTTLRLVPAYYSTMPNGSSVRCVADNGYPDPNIQWHFISGPFNHDWYFNIFTNQLFMLSNAPIDSAWTFNCIAENVIPNSRANSTSLLFRFTVVHSSRLTLIIVGGSAGTAIIILIFVVTLIIIFRPSRRRRQKRPSHSHGNNNQPATVRKELAFDPDTAGSLRLSSSTECLPDEALPKYEDTAVEDKLCDSKVVASKDNANTCYV